MHLFRPHDRPELTDYVLTCTSAPLSKWRDSQAGIGCSGSDSLHLIYDGGGAYFNFSPRNDGRWVLGSVQAKDIVGFSITGLRDYDKEQTIYGDLEFDLATLDASTLPDSFEQACSMLNTEGYAMVNSDVSANRLNLRTAPSKDVKSIGKYYSGTPVRIVSDEGEWCKVSIFGVEGYCMREFLAFDQSMLNVPRFFLTKFIREEYIGHGIPVHHSPDSTSDLNGTLDDTYGAWPTMFILGVVGDDWYHVVSENGLSGYVEAKYYWDGNG